MPLYNRKGNIFNGLLTFITKCDKIESEKIFTPTEKMKGAVNMTKAQRFKLYKAIQYEAHEYETEHGYTMAKLWEKAKENSWWADVSIWDYCKDNGINPETMMM